MKAILFDMDGTLLDSMGMWHRVELEFLESLGVDPTAFDYNKTITMGIEHTLALIRQEFGIETNSEAMSAYVSKRMAEFYQSEAQLKPGVLSILEGLRKAGVWMAIGTATMEELAKIALAHTGIEDFFEFVHSSSTDGHSKNMPDFFERAAQRFGLKPVDLALFDDAYNALLAAKSIGYFTVGVQDKAYSQDVEAIRRVADDFVSDFSLFDMEAWARDKGLIPGKTGQV